MFFLLGLVFLVLSASGLAVSLLRLKEHIPSDASNVKFGGIMEVVRSFEWVSDMPHEALLLVAVFLIASVLSLGAVSRSGSSSKRNKSTGYVGYRTTN